MASYARNWLGRAIRDTTWVAAPKAGWAIAVAVAKYLIEVALPGEAVAPQLGDVAVVAVAYFAIAVLHFVGRFFMTPGLLASEERARREAEVAQLRSTIAEHERQSLGQSTTIAQLTAPHDVDHPQLSVERLAGNDSASHWIRVAVFNPAGGVPTSLRDDWHVSVRLADGTTREAYRVGAKHEPGTPTFDALEPGHTSRATLTAVFGASTPRGPLLTGATWTVRVTEQNGHKLSAPPYVGNG